MTVCYWCGAKDTLVDVGKELDDGKYKMVQCSQCKNAYYVYVANKEKMNKPKPMTNEEWFCSLPTEEKAKWLQEHMDCSYCDCNKDLCYKGYDCCELAFWEWLKQPHTAK